jgi:hypothetical protein
MPGGTGLGGMPKFWSVYRCGLNRSEQKCPPAAIRRAFAT